MKTLSDLPVENKRVLVRVDFNVPQDPQGNITDDSRIRASLKTIAYLLEKNAKIILVSHLGRPKGKKSDTFSLKPCAEKLSEYLKKEVVLAPDTVGPEVEALVKKMQPKDIILLENVRFYPEEEKPTDDDHFAKQLASLADIYVNDAFGTAHRAHSSTTNVAKYFEHKAPGFLLAQEIEFLGSALQNPKRPFFAIVGGAKVSTKLGVLDALLDKVDSLYLAGGMAYTFFKAKGISIGNSIVENEMVDDAKKIIEKANAKGTSLYLPIDIVAADAFSNDAKTETFSMQKGIKDGFEGVDIGPETMNLWEKELKKAKTILWNGPVGVFEMENFAKGTFFIAKVLASLTDCTTIVGGGDSVAAVNQAKLADSMSHVSTGGGASLEYVENGSLVGIEVLN